MDMNKTIYELNKQIHAILINPYLSSEDFKTNCYLINKYGIKNVSTSLQYLTYLKESIIDKKVNINVLISYPFSDIPQIILNDLSIYAKDSGADGIEYMPKYFFLSNDQDESFANDIEQLSRSELPITLIFNKHSFEKEKLIRAIEISIDLGIKKFQFGDGFAPPIKPFEISEILSLLRDKSFLKVVGGIRNINQVIDLLDAGVDSIGTSSFHEIFKAIKFK